MNDCTLTGNTEHVGGAIYNVGTCTLNDCTLTGNTANHDDGGAIYNYYGTLTANDCNFNGNTAHSSYFGGGGAICNYDGTLTATNCNFNGNRAGDQMGSGGAICNYDAGTLYVIGCNFNGNSASGSEYGNGGAIFNRYGYCSVTNSIFTDNTAHLTTTPGVNFINYIDMYMLDGYGGDICNGANLDVINCIFNGNHAVDIPGGVFNVFGVVTNFNLNRILGNTNIQCWGAVNWGINWYVPASLIVTITGPTTVNAGNTITYTITVTNNGQGHADNVQIQDIIPTILQNLVHDSFNLGTINEGSSKTVTITGTVPSSVTQGTIIENSATVTSRTPATITPSNIIRTIIYVIKTNPLIKKTLSNNLKISQTFAIINNGLSRETIANLITLQEWFKTGNNYGDGGWSYVSNNMTIAGLIIAILAVFGVLVALKRK
ncbi:MAG: DUF11 domain-containing protein [Methanobacterium sp.]|uniref:DUF11 domain-containing protein n=1 Tax=Methanobacterium sp. TaxID=2164 RepID=UPI003D652DAF|nr:DUF11 domain-containing protein [Methanobacterium sp.]